jgi:hypothetical protein
MTMEASESVRRVVANHAITVAGFDFERLCGSAAGHTLDMLDNQLEGWRRAAVIAQMAGGMEFRNGVRAVLLAVLEQLPEREAKLSAAAIDGERAAHRQIIYLDRGGEVLVRLREESQ